MSTRIETLNPENTTGKSKICNWGDYRIPLCNDLDIGTGEFSPNPKYLKNGWSNYIKAYSNNSNQKVSKEAQQIENEKWWSQNR